MYEGVPSTYGYDGDHVSGSGCALCSAATMLSALGVKVTPEKLDQKLKTTIPGEPQYLHKKDKDGTWSSNIDDAAWRAFGSKYRLHMVFKTPKH